MFWHMFLDFILVVTTSQIVNGVHHNLVVTIGHIGELYDSLIGYLKHLHSEKDSLIDMATSNTMVFDINDFLYTNCG